MFYATDDLKEFGLTLQDVRLRTGASIPEGADDIPGYRAYIPADIPGYDPITKRAFETTPEVIDGVLTMQWATLSLDDETIAANRKRAAEQERRAAKEARAAAVAAIKVTTSTGKTFDGDETSQTRMARAIVGMQAANAVTIGWVLSDNTMAAVSVQELTEAMVLAGQEQSRIWPV